MAINTQNFSINTEKLNNLIKQISEQNTKEQKTNVAWVPEGSHKIRFLLDPDQELFRDVYSHKLGDLGRIICPNHLTKIGIKKSDGSPLPSCEICEIINKYESAWPYGARLDVLIYGIVMETSVTDSKYFREGNPYVLAVKYKFKTAISYLLRTLVKDAPEFITSAFNPTISGGYFNVSFVAGRDGFVNISPVLIKQGSPIQNLASWWKPLNEVWMLNVFEEEKYIAAVEFARNIEKEILKKENLDKLNLNVKNSSATSVASSSRIVPKEVFKTPTVTTAPTIIKSVPVPDVIFQSASSEDDRPACFGNYTDVQSSCIVCMANVDCMEMKQG